MTIDVGVINRAPIKRTFALKFVLDILGDYEYYLLCERL